MFPSLTKIFKQNKAIHSRGQIYQALLRREAALGGTLFGPLQKGARREFFCLDEKTWVWHEEWLDTKGERQHRTTRYEVHSSGILKVQDGIGYQRLSPAETENFRQAVLLYHDKVVGPLYGHLGHA